MKSQTSPHANLANFKSNKTFDPGEGDERLHLALQAARLGREVLLKYAGKLRSVQKKHLAGWVSEADKESERVIFNFLNEKFPQDLLLGEESFEDGNDLPIASSGRWILDPLDGTTNYIHGFPAYAVSLGYEREGKILLGVVDCPALGEVYCGVAGGGSWVNGVKLQTSQTQSMNEALLATGFFGEVEEDLQEQLRIFGGIVRKCRGVRRAGAAAYDMCLVAKGVFDAFWEHGLSPWDTAAGQIIVQEAGGVTRTYEGKEYNPFEETLVCSNPFLVSEILTHTRK